MRRPSAIAIVAQATIFLFMTLVIFAGLWSLDFDPLSMMGLDRALR